MPDTISCPTCGKVVSRRAIFCRSCGQSISEVPEAATGALIDSLHDDDLADFMFQFATAVFGDHGIDTPTPDTLTLVPTGIRAGYSLVVLDSEVGNGGFYQWFTNSSGMIARETLEALRVIGAARHFDLVQRAIRLNDRLEADYPEYRNRWSSDDEPGVCGADAADTRFWADVQANFMPQFDRMSSEFYALENADWLWHSFVRYVRGHAGECVHCRH
jgi:hypothetical protein